MKRLIPAAIILIFVITVCIGANLYVNTSCKETLNDIDAYYNQTITASQLEKFWKERKEKMSLFVNHGFLDKISIYIGQLTVQENNNSPDSNVIYKSIESVLELIKAEQKFALHSFY